MIESSMSITQQMTENYKKKIYSGETKERYLVRISFVEIGIPVFFLPYEQYDIVEEWEQIHLFGDYKIPVCYGKKQIREYREEETTYSKEEVKETFERQIQKKLQTLEEKGVQIIEKNVTINKYKGIWTLKVILTVNKKADTFEKIQ